MRWRSWVIITPPKRDDPIYPSKAPYGSSAAERLRSTPDYVNNSWLWNALPIVEWQNPRSFMSRRLLGLTSCFIFLSQVSLAQRNSACEQATNLSGLIDRAQKQTLLSLTMEPIRLVIAAQREAPAQLVPPTSHGFDLLMAATLKNRSEKTIVSYRIGWGYVLKNGIEFHTGALMSVPSGLKPGRLHSVPAQGIHLAPDAEQVIFFVAELTFANGGHWMAKKKDLQVHMADLKSSRPEF